VLLRIKWQVRKVKLKKRGQSEKHFLMLFSELTLMMGQKFWPIFRGRCGFAGSELSPVTE